ncbi:MAG: hypothetical protein LJE62_13895 [Silicimonas sp.]|nr:hypothetical protein [Silicimonas sp.]
MAGVFAFLVAGPSLAWFEPERGTKLRSELMDAIRPQAEAELGAPVQFVVDTLRVDGNVGFAALEPQRPGGVRIRWEDTQMAARGEGKATYDGKTIHVLYAFDGAAWGVTVWTLGATDVWWANPQLCETYGPVTPEAC